MYKLSRVFVKDIEYDIFNLEGVRIVFRTSEHNLMPGYSYDEPIDDNVTVNQWVKERIYPLINNTFKGNSYVADMVQYEIVAKGETIHNMRMTMGDLRSLTNKKETEHA